MLKKEKEIYEVKRKKQDFFLIFIFDVGRLKMTTPYVKVFV